MIVAPERFETAHLDCTRLRASDLDFMCAIESDAVVQQYIFGARTRAETVARTAKALAVWDERGFGTWIARTKDGTPAGTCLLFPTRFEDEDAIELGYMLLPGYWGRGWASEMARALLDIAFGVLERPGVIAITAPENVPSRRVLEKAGMLHDGDVPYNGETICRYRLRREQWLARAAT